MKQLFGKLVVLSILAACNAASLGSPLYDAQDPMHILNNDNFRSTLVNTNRSFFLIQFYNSWCGHCVRFAPKFKEYANDVQGWRSAVDIGVVNCADEENTKLCRDHAIQGYPTLKAFFIPHDAKNPVEDTVELNGRDLGPLRKEIITFIEERIAKHGAQKNFPNLKASSATTINDLWNSVSSDIRSIFVVVEDEKSIIGRETALDFSGVKNSSFVRFIRGHAPPEFKDRDVISLLRLDKGVHPVLLDTASESDARSKFRKIFESSGIVPGHDSNNDDGESKPDPEPHPKPEKKDQTKIYIDDIEAALYDTLHVEVAGKKTHEEGDLVTLRRFLQEIYENIQLPERIAEVLRGLRRSLERPAPLSGEDYVKLLGEVQKPTAFLRKDVIYQGCHRGVENKRGYTCALWTIFHLLTTGSYTRYKQNQISNPSHALFTIRDYVGRYLSCRTCREHFGVMAKNMEQELKTPEDTVLWLWKAHNVVNNRTKDDPTLDPDYPKVIFPLKTMCTTCYDDNNEFNEQGVLDFFLKHYSANNMVISKDSQTPNYDEHRPGGSGDSTNGILSRLDFTLFLIVYAVSITLLFVVFASVVCKRRKGNFMKSVFHLH